MAEVEMYKRTPVEQDLLVRRSKETMRGQVMMFSLMIFMTLASFTFVVAYQQGVDGFTKYLVIPVLFLFAAVQVALQLYYFMHMKDKEHGVPQMFMFTGALLGFLIPLAFVTIVWW
ncbi:MULTISPECIES: cytochrome C oxidase subunit IV family protein [Sporosarcina]|uniref:cytochrome C oxidase subunit IV family protein n=1 Tax=Sporosarcina TaxID=1569 RepID=UPI00058F4C42|nr:MULTISPECIES: cytochrome C oxidase subunit IV family protein [Sporosarcina]WJY28845.1 cytochrome C oxidase subunit IV family protein [Sporosarcina sp. 0.2-SM1T-5]